VSNYLSKQSIKEEGTMKNNIIQRMRYVFFFVLTTLLISACDGQDITDLKKYVAKIKTEEKPPIDPIPQYKLVPKYPYGVQKLRDPFIVLEKRTGTERRSFDRNKSETKKGPTCPRNPILNRVRSGLELMPLDTLQMVGTLKSNGNQWALMASKSDGAIYRVKQHDYMGENYGQIINVSNDQVEILEQLPDGKGCWKQEIMTIRLTTVQ
jgi:type IV pilus assembly protein PilP